MCRQLLGPLASMPSASLVPSASWCLRSGFPYYRQPWWNRVWRPIKFRHFILINCPYQLPPTPYSRQLLFMLTDYGVFPSVVYVFLWLGGKIIKWAASSCRAFNASDTWWFPIGSAPDEASLRLPRLFIPYISLNNFKHGTFCWKICEKGVFWPNYLAFIFL